MRRCVLTVTMVFLAAIAVAERAHAVEAEALILTDVQIDGDLSDWPDGMRQYAVGNAPAAYAGARVDGPADLSARFMVGHDPDQDLLYIAVIVRDDDLVIGHGVMSTDACELYIHPGEGHSGGPAQYVLVPGPGDYGGNRQNPRIPRGAPQALAAYSRSGDTTIYEWAVGVPGDGGPVG